MPLDPAKTATKSVLASLRRYVRPRPPHALCELCSAPLSEEHAHLLELANRRLCCTCEPCAILFSNPTAPKYRRVPRRVQRMPDFQLTDLQWESLQLPINLAFFVVSSTAQRVVAYYPSPAGATEALPPPDSWQTLVQENACLGKLEPDVEALLVNRLGTESDYYWVGIDHCYALVGVVRTHWRGLTGGAEVWKEIGRFFDNLVARASV
jgi:hypothetical protein